MRGALKPFAGVEIVDLKAGNTKFQVKYDPAKVKVEDMLAALDKAREPAKKID
ncbi:MAG: hypothetical protein H6836_05400 [Planctomycetes bacterium]|nr:hypothetical protein [Planctomycetota bacterium]MCB9888992.1 hypothetical protein [Planctomycetota bacterium]